MEKPLGLGLRWTIGLILIAFGVLALDSPEHNLIMEFCGIGAGMLGALFIAAPARAIKAFSAFHTFQEKLGKAMAGILIFVFGGLYYVGLPLLVLYLLVRFVKWAWQG